MGDYKHLIDFVKWSKANYPAKNYMLIVWNHGAGWLKNAKNKGISYDDETNNHITTVQLGQALAEVGGVDIYASDACLMQMAEVVAELAPYAKYIVGSEESEGGDGYNYATFLDNLPSDPKFVAIQCAKMADAGYSRDSTQSVIDTSKMEDFPAKVDAWVGTVMANLSTTTVKNLARQTQSYAYSDNKDMGDFVQKLNAAIAGAYEEEIAALRAPTKEGEEDSLGEKIRKQFEIAKKQSQLKRITKAGDKFLEYMTTQLVISNFTSENMKKSTGLAVYIPNYGMNKDYESLQWAQGTQWPAFLKWLNAK
ncbi:MAG TPA: clostripain-related cysteine peptidase, partial [Elusimicrobiales bacterium]|nr:clostripain-related cysteine peptidase [Elusimicrobiales bacterium]